MFDNLSKKEPMSLNELGTLIKVLQNDSMIAKRFYVDDYDFLSGLLENKTSRQKSFVYHLMDKIGKRIQLYKMLVKWGLKTKEECDVIAQERLQEDIDSANENNPLPGIFPAEVNSIPF